MKNLNLVLALALLGLMYKTPVFLLDVTNNPFGRIILVIALAYIVIRCDFSCAILFSLIIIVLFHNNIEGFVEGLTIDDDDDDEEPKDSGSGDEEKKGSDDKEKKDKKNKDEKEKESMEESMEELMEEPFTGMTKKVNSLRQVLRSNITDLDRELKVGAERRSISATKQ
tara:strand:+ start:14137 stop:14643 length:507 start_codon:yes stop_codon:yes gene_type:complete